VVDAESNVCNIVSQSDVIQFLARNINHYGKIAQVTLNDINLGQKSQIFNVNYKTSALHAFHEMWIRKISAVAVVDNSGILLANLSVSDLRVIFFIQN
jgi:CBS-domain-containing membrane protein